MFLCFKQGGCGCAHACAHATVHMNVRRHQAGDHSSSTTWVPGLSPQAQIQAPFICWAVLLVSNVLFEIRVEKEMPLVLQSGIKMYPQILCILSFRKHPRKMDSRSQAFLSKCAHRPGWEQEGPSAWWAHKTGVSQNEAGAGKTWRRQRYGKQDWRFWVHGVFSKDQRWSERGFWDGHESCSAS